MCYRKIPVLQDNLTYYTVFSQRRVPCRFLFGSLRSCTPSSFSPSPSAPCSESSPRTFLSTSLVEKPCFSRGFFISTQFQHRPRLPVIQKETARPVRNERFLLDQAVCFVPPLTYPMPIASHGMKERKNAQNGMAPTFSRIRAGMMIV